MKDPAQLKNDNERKEWLEHYYEWNLWYRDEHIGVNYYRYEFQNGATLVVDEYKVPETKYSKAYYEAFYHLIGGPEPKKLYWPYHAVYDRMGLSKTYLVCFLKETKGGVV